MTVDYQPSESTMDLTGWVQKDVAGQRIGDLQQSLTSPGDDGWELVAVVPCAVAGNTRFKAIFKQPQSTEKLQPETKEYTMTVGELRGHLKCLPDDYDLVFGNGNLAVIDSKRQRLECLRAASKSGSGGKRASMVTGTPGQLRAGGRPGDSRR